MQITSSSFTLKNKHALTLVMRILVLIVGKKCHSVGHALKDKDTFALFGSINLHIYFSIAMLQ